jgi:alpha-amylase
MADSERHADVSRRGVLKGLGGAVAAATAGVGFAQSATADAGESVALQYFHEDWQTITDDLERVGSLGFDAIWIQQPAESMLDWSDQGGRNQPPLGYQPVDYRNFDSSFGTEAELQTLIDTAHDNDVDVIVDTVLNHMANASADAFPQFEDEHFHNQGGIEQWAYSFDANDSRCFENGDTGGTPKDPDRIECDPSIIENSALLSLRDLDQDQEYVREQLKNYVDKIASLGADGHRFDGAKHMPESFFANYANQWAEDNGMFRVGEVYSGNREYLRGYANTGPGMYVFDFALYYTMNGVFDGGDMSRLEGAGLIATDPGKSMPFVENHDVDAPSQYELAHAFMLSSEGYPMLYNLFADDLLENDNIVNAVWVKKNLAGGQTIWRQTDSDLAVFEREGNLLTGLNNGDTDRTVTVETSWSEQDLRDYAGNAENVTTAGDGSVEITVPAGGWVFYAEPGQGDPTDGIEREVPQITLQVEAPTAEGESVYFTGSKSALTNWGGGIEGTENDGVWEVTIDDPGTFQWKTRRGPAGGSGDVWEDGENHDHENLNPTHQGWEDGYGDDSSEDSNDPPTATFSATPSEPTVGQDVTLDASASSDPDGNVESYEWDLTGDGSTDATGQQVTHSFDAAETYDVTLTVTDNSGATSTEATTVSVEAADTTTQVETETQIETTTQSETETQTDEPTEDDEGTTPSGSGDGDGFTTVAAITGVFGAALAAARREDDE